MITLIKHLYKDYFSIFYYVIVLEVLFKLIYLNFRHSEVIGAVYAIWILISSTILIATSSYLMYKYIFTREKFFYYTIKYNMHVSFFILTLMFCVLNYLYYLIYSMFGSIEVFEAIQKFFSLLCYFMVIATIYYNFRGFKNARISKNASLVVIIAFFVLYSLNFCTLFKEKMGFFMIGATSYTPAKNIYAGILPITLINYSENYFTLAKISLTINVIIATISIISYRLSIRKKINW